MAKLSARGRVIDEVVWEKDGITITVPVKIRASGRGGADSEFVAEWPDDKSIRVVGTDLAEVTKKIRELLNARHTVVWSPWIHVSVPPPDRHFSSWHAVTVELHFDVDYYIVGILADGSKIHQRVPEQSIVNGVWTGMKYSGEESESRAGGVRGGGSLVPATVENCAAIKRFCQAAKDLWSAVESRFAPDNVKATLLGLSAGMPALPIPENEEDTPDV